MRGQSYVRIIGIDPGLRRTGWGVIETDGVRLSYVSSGLVTSTSDEDLAYRLRELFEGLSSVIAGVSGIVVDKGGGTMPYKSSPGRTRSSHTRESLKRAALLAACR